MDFETQVALLRPMIEPLVDYFFHDCAFLWYELRDDDGLDLVPESAAVDFKHVPSPLAEPERRTLTTLRGIDSPEDVFSIVELEPEEPIPEIMERWQHHLEDLNFDTMMDISYGDGAHLKWAMENGILPRQPFLICVTPPRWFRSSWEYQEYDFDFEAMIVDRLPPESTERDVARFLDDTARGKAILAEERSELDSIRRADVDRMYLYQEWYFAGGHIDEMSTPNGVRRALCSSWNTLKDSKSGHWRLVSGESDKGDLQQAMAQLRERVAAEFPHVVERLEKMLLRHSW